MIETILKGLAIAPKDKGLLGVNGKKHQEKQ